MHPLNCDSAKDVARSGVWKNKQHATSLKWTLG